MKTYPCSLNNNQRGKLMKSQRVLLILALLLLLFVLPTMVYAHDETTVSRFGSFIAGLTHPILGLDHLLASSA